MNCPKAAGLALAGVLTLGLALGGSPLLAAALPQSSAGESSELLPKAQPKQLAIARLVGMGLDEAEALATWDALPAPRQLALLQALDQPVWLDYLAYDFAWLERLDRYQAYHTQYPELTAEEAVVQVNIGLDTSPYEEPDLVSDPDSLTALVNQYHALPEDYVPQLVSLDPAYTNQRDEMHPEAYRAFVRMADAAAQEGVRLYNASAYRSYTTQKWVYQRYVNQDGTQQADTYSARPGCSEHQTGLALDINTASLSDHFEETPEYAWLVENCAQFGFILRFPDGKEELTGYQFEPWHYRYVGTGVAMLCAQRGWTLEEYVARRPAPDRPEF